MSTNQAIDNIKYAKIKENAQPNSNSQSTLVKQSAS